MQNDIICKYLEERMFGADGDERMSQEKLRCNENGDFTVLVVADPQCEKDFQWKEAADELEILLKKENPDFVLINGDMETNNLITKEKLEILIQPIIKRNIFWSTVNGNHDPFRKEINDMYLEFDKCLNQNH